MFTDKLVAKIPSTATGKITAINFGDDDVIPVGHVILTIDESGENAEATSSDSSDDDIAVQASEPAVNNVSAHK